MGVGRVLWVMLMVGLAGCVSMEAPLQPSPEQLAKADYGAKPAPSGFESAIREWALTHLKDPDSLRLREVSPDATEGWIAACVEPGIPPYTSCSKRMFYFGYLVTAMVNAKNTYGGYTGFTRYTFLFRGDRIARSTP